MMKLSSVSLSIDMREKTDPYPLPYPDTLANRPSQLASTVSWQRVRCEA